eukprot:757588-Hanusia_phi.AAC.2
MIRLGLTSMTPALKSDSAPKTASLHQPRGVAGEELHQRPQDHGVGVQEQHRLVLGHVEDQQLGEEQVVAPVLDLRRVDGGGDRDWLYCLDGPRSFAELPQ